MIIKHYLRRLLTEPIGLAINVAFPVVIVVLNTVINVDILDAADQSLIVNGYSVMATVLATIIMVMFQFMYGTHIVDLLFRDFRSATRWRLLAAPKSINKYIFSAMLACVFFSILAGVLIMAVAAIFLDAHLHNPFILIGVITITSIFSQIFGMLVFLLVRKKGTAEAICVLFSFAMVVPAGHFLITFNMGRVVDFIFGYLTPYALAMRAILSSGIMGNTVNENFTGNFAYGRDMSTALLNMGALAATTAALAIITAIVARRRSV